MTDPRYPIGRFSVQDDISKDQVSRFINDIEQAPAMLRAAVTGLTDAQLDTPYRDGGWTLRQVVHHVADSHINAYVRHRLALTEESPTIKPYNQDLWASLHDALAAPPEFSLTLLASLHGRWVALLRSIRPEDFSRTYTHPESGRVRLDRNLGLYAWHGRHHTAQITALRERMGWT